MWDKAVDDFLPTLKFVPDWFVTSKTIKKTLWCCTTDDETFFFDEDSGNVTFSSDEMGILSVDLNSINLGYATFYEDDWNSFKGTFYISRQVTIPL